MESREKRALKAILAYTKAPHLKTLAEAVAELTIIKMVAAEALAPPNTVGVEFPQPHRARPPLNYGPLIECEEPAHMK